MFGRHRDADLDHDIQAHLEALAADYERRGLSPQAAREAARRDFGGITQMKDAYRDQRRFGWLDDCRHDIKIGVRGLRRNPGFAVVAVLTMALGIGANTAMFSIANGVLFSPLPYNGSDRLVMVWHDNTREDVATYPMSPANFLDYKRAATRVGHLEGMLSFTLGASLTRPSGTEQLNVHLVTPGLFALLGRDAQIGRVLGAHDVTGVLLSDAFWTERFGRDPAVIGRSLLVDGRPFTVAGVMPRDFDFPLLGMLGPANFATNTAVDVWGLLDWSDPRAIFPASTRSVHVLSVIGRLPDGVTPAQAQQEAAAIMRRLETDYPQSNAGLGANVVPLHDQAVGGTRPMLAVLLAGVGCVLLIACVNVTNLLLARSAARQNELAVCSALGASPRRLMRKVLVETLVIAGAGAAAAVVLVFAATNLFVRLAPPDIPRLGNVAPTWEVLLFGLGLSVAVGVVAGLVPALAAGRSNPQGTLKEVGRVAGLGGLHRRMRQPLVVGQIALAVMLAIGGGLLARSFARLINVDPGFRAEQLLTLQVTLPPTIPPPARLAFYDQMLGRLSAVPGVVKVGGTTRLPLGSGTVSTVLLPEGGLPDATFEVEFRRAVGEYFETMGIPVLRGRAFTAADGPEAPPVVVVNQALAQRVWPGEEPIGKRLRIGVGSPGTELEFAL